jgi:uncharacterized RDD family membrane protein YckC
MMPPGGIVVLKQNSPRGPFTRQQVQEALDRGEFTLQYLAHTPGLPEWLPLGEVLHHLDLHATPRPVPPARTLPPLPSLPSAEIQSPPPLVAAAASAPAAPEIHARPPALPPAVVAQTVFAARDHQLVAAPFGRRLTACLIDFAILFVPAIALFCTAYLISTVQGALERQDAESIRQAHALLWRDFQRLLVLLVFGFGWIYGAGLESSRWQATVGKQWMRLAVTTAEGGRMNFLRATGRHAAKYLSGLPLLLGFAAALVSKNGLAWHDRLAKTRVIQQ